ncbi:MAG: AlkZ family DNA glycosylase [Anaerolineae bacterium]|nr:AlkZ family DNA glycosylase [Anaerolineae bacterium]
MTDRVLTLRDLNRATLSRQLLLERSTLSTSAAIQRLVGLQAQVPLPPYVGLWTRVQNFQRDDLASLIEKRSVIKATLMRATLHLATTDDYLWLRPTLQPVLTSAQESIAKRRGEEVDVNELVAVARDYIAKEPRTFAELSAMLSELHPDTDVGSMRYTVRTHLPLVQVPITTGWSYPGTPKFTLADDWLGKPIPDTEHLRELVFRYLAAFGPASATDMQSWSGLAKLKEVFEQLKPDLRVYRDETKREMFDLPDLELPDADTPAPVRFLPEFDNILLSHSKRTRIVADAYRSQVYLPALRVAATILVDGFVHGAWKVEKTKTAATLVITPFEPLTASDRKALTEEAEKLVRFIEGSAKNYEVKFVD